MNIYEDLNRTLEKSLTKKRGFLRLIIIFCLIKIFWLNMSIGVTFLLLHLNVFLY